MEKLAYFGGEPVRKQPFPSNYIGAAMVGDEELEEIKEVISERSLFRHYGMGNPQKVNTFESKLSEYFGGKLALAVSSGSASLYCAAVALGVGPGDEVIIPSFGWYPLFNAVANMGALPVFADIDESLHMDPADLERKITNNTKAAFVIHYQGRAANLDALMKITAKHGIKLVEDCAQGFGAFYGDKPVGSYGDIACLSFQQNKFITSGEGGALITGCEEFYARAAFYHDMGIIRPIFAKRLSDKSLYEPSNAFYAMQFRMGELPAACLLGQLKRFDGMKRHCRENYRRICNHFEGNEYFRIIHSEGDSGITVFLLFADSAKAAEFKKYIEAEGVVAGGTSACANIVEKYPIMSKKQPHNALPPFGKGYPGEYVTYNIENCCPNTNEMISRNVAIGLGVLYGEKEITDIIDAIEKVCGHLDWGK